MHFADRLFRAVDQKETPLCVGFDPHLALIPAHLLDSIDHHLDPLERYARAVETFCMQILDAVADLVPAVKPQFAFFERLGSPGMRVLARLCAEAVSRDLIVIGDAKRGDIGSTAEAYSEAYLAPPRAGFPEPDIRVDAITLNPYMGFEAIQPFLCPYRKTGVFVLVKTSNPSGCQIQDIPTHEGTVADSVADLVVNWGSGREGDCGYSDVGAVVGAPYPEAAIGLRRRMPKTIFLIPGYGFQGGGSRDAMITLDQRGHGGIVNSSRAILFAFQKGIHAHFGPERYAEAARAATIDAITDLRNGFRALHP